MIEIKLHKDMFGASNPDANQFVGAFSKLIRLRYAESFDGDYNVYTGRGNHNAISPADMLAYSGIPGMLIAANEYGFSVPDIDATVPETFPGSSVSTYDEGGNLLNTVQKSWRDYTIWHSYNGQYFVYIGQKVNGNFNTLPGDEIHRIFFEHFQIQNILHYKQTITNDENGTAEP